MEECSTSAASGDGRNVFAGSPNGQLKMPRVGNYCLTLVGDSAYDIDVAHAADASATSSNAEHAVKNIADGDAQSYWASGNDPTAPVDVQLDLGGTLQIKTIKIDWEYPALVCVYGSAQCARASCNVSVRDLSYRSPVVASGPAYMTPLATMHKRQPMF